MEAKLEGKGESAIFLIIGKDGRRYKVESQGLTAVACRMLFEQEMKGHVLSCIEKSLTDEDIHSHRDAKYPLCGSGLMGWASSFQKVLHADHDKNCGWVMTTLLNRVSKELKLF